MKNVKFLLTLVLTASLSYVNAQDYVKSTITTKHRTSFKGSHKIILKHAILSDGNYMFSNKKEKVFVNLKNGIYTEFYPDNKYVKAEIEWISEYVYKLKIIDFNIRYFKFKIGEEFTSEITNVSNRKYSYKTKLENGKIYRGKLIKIEEKNSRMPILR